MHVDGASTANDVAMGGGESPATVLERVAEGIRAATGAARSAVVVGEDGNAAIHFVAAAGPDTARLVGARGPAEGSGLCGNVLEGSCPILAAEAVGDPRVHQGHAAEMGITTALGVPVFHDGHAFAVLMALNRVDGSRFAEADEGALTRYAGEIADELWTASGGG